MQRNRETDDADDSEEVPSLATCVRTLQEAVKLSIIAGLTADCLFVFARALKAFEITTGRRLPPGDLAAAFALWWSAAKPLLPPDADFDEWRFDFESTFEKTRVALGANPLEEAIRRADSNKLPSQADRYSSPKLKRLIAVCYHLQLLAGKSPFFLSQRSTSKITETKNLQTVSAQLAGLVRDGVLREVSKGLPGGQKATRFRFVVLEVRHEGEKP